MTETYYWHMKNKCPHLRSALPYASKDPKEHLANVKLSAPTCVCQDWGMDECCEGMGNWHLTTQSSFYVPPCPPSWHVQIQRRTCQSLEIVSGQWTMNWCFPVCSVCTKKEHKQLLHFWKAHVLKFLFAPKLQEEALIVVTHYTWAHSENRKWKEIFFWHVKLVYLTTALCKMSTCHYQTTLDMCHCVKLWTNVSSLCSVKPYAQPVLDRCHHELAIHMSRRRRRNGWKHRTNLCRPQVEPPRLNTDLSCAQAMLRNGKSCHWDFKK